MATDELTRIMEKVMRYLQDKESLNLKDSFFVCKRLEEDYWEQIQLEGENAREEGDFSDFEETSDEEEIVDTKEEEPKKKKMTIKGLKEDGNDRSDSSKSDITD